MEQFLNTYYDNNAKKLHTVIDQIFYKYFGGTKGKDMEEFYGIGTDVLIEIWEKKTYDASKGDFDGYIYRALSMAFIDEFKKQNRDKRSMKIKVMDKKIGKLIKVSVPDLRLDAPLSEDSNITQGDMVQSDFNLDTKVFEDIGSYSENVEKFLESLSDMQKEIALLIMKGYEAKDIKCILNMTDKQYKECWSVITSYDKKRILYKENNNVEDREMNTITMEENVTEKYKNTSTALH